MRFLSWRTWLRRTFGPTKTAPLRRTVRPRLEPLEQRWVPSFASTTAQTITVSEGTLFNGTVASFTANDGGPFTASINWGDGSTTTGTVVGNTAPVGLTGFNQDVVFEAGTSSPHITSAFDVSGTGTGGSAWFQAGAQDTGSTVHNDGLPASFTSNNGTPFTFQSFTASNVLLLGDGNPPTGMLTLTTPTAYSNIAILASSANASLNDTGTFTITFSDSSTATFNYNASDWFQTGGTGAALPSAVSRATNVNNTFVGTNDGDHFQMFETDVNLAAAGDGGKTITSITFSLASGAGATGIFAVSGTANFQVLGSHTYHDEFANGLPVTVTVTDTSDASNTAISSSANVTEADVLAPQSQIASIAGPEPLNFNSNSLPNGLFTFTDTNPNTGAGDFTATITWGDGSTTQGDIIQVTPSSYRVDGSHVYTDEGSFTINVTVQDDSPGTASVSANPIPVTVAENDTLTGASVAISATENASFSGTVATFHDSTNPTQLANDFTATIDWGDSTTPSTGTVIALGGGNFAVSGTHTYADEGSFSVAVTITDDGTGTATAAASSTAHVTEADLLSATGTTLATVTEGFSISGTVATFTDTGYPTNAANDFTATIDWGDNSGTTTGTVSFLGGGDFAVSGSHVYTDEGSFTVTVTIHDDAPGTASATATSTASVTEGDSLGATGTIVTATENASFSGTVATFTDTLDTNTAGDFSATIDWGDNTTSTGTVIGIDATDFAVSGTHTYADEGTFSVTVTIHDDAPGTASATATSTASIAEADTLAGSGVAINVSENASFSGTVAFFGDSSYPTNAANDFTATISWGDNTTSTGVVSGSNGVFAVSGTHTYADEGSFIATVTIIDNAPGTASATVTAPVSVAEADTLAASGTSVSATENTAFSGTVATFSDTGYPTNPANDFTATINWGDGGTSTGVVSGSNGSFAVSGTHTYADEGSFTVTVTIADNAPGTASTTTTGTASVAEADTLAGTVTAVAATEGRLFSGTVATFTDAGYPTNSPNDFTAVILWGDGQSSSGTVSGSNGNFTVTGSHVYQDEGTFSVEVLILDDSPGTASVAPVGTATVAEGDTLSATSGGGITATEGTAFSGTVATFTDAGFPANPANDFTATISWGDGTSTGTVVSLGGGNFAVQGSHVFTDEGSFAVTVTIQDDGSGTASAQATSTSSVAENDGLTATGAVVNTTEGRTFAGPVASFTDSDTTTAANDFTATISWGDGGTSTGVVSGANGSFTVSGTHSYADEGTFTVTVTIADDAPGTASATASSAASVAENDVLSASGTSVSATENASFSGTVATFTSSFTGNVANDFTATISWGDSTTSTGVVSGANGNFAVAGTHTYADEGTFSVTVTIADDAPGTASAAASTTVSVAEADALAATGATVSATENAAFSGAVASFTDFAYPTNAANDFTATIDWGDNTTSTGTVSQVIFGGFVVSGTHTYADEGSYTVSVTVTDNAPGTASAAATSTATVAEGDLLAGTGAAVSATEGTTFSGTVATFGDADTGNVANDFTATINWGDGGTSTGVVSGANGSFAVSGSHTYADEGSFTVSVTITDNAPGTASATALGVVGVTEADVLGGSAAPISTTEGTNVSGTIATFTDSYTANVANDFTATINWGDGSTSTGTVSGGGGSFSVSGSHTYTASGTFTVAVTLTDDAPGTASATATTTASVSGNVVVNGTNGNDTLILFETAGGGVGSITYILNGGPPVVLTGVQSFTFNGLGGNDTMIVDAVNGKPLVPNGVFYDGGTGTNNLTINANNQVLRDVPGAITFADPKTFPVTVSYKNTQSTNVNTAASVDAVAGPDTADRGTAFVGLNADERFVQAVYLDELGRPGSKAELDAWAALFNGTGPDSRVQAEIATAIIHSREAEDRLVKSWYVTFLGRQAQGGEENWAVNLLSQGQTEEQVLSLLLASSEFYSRAQTLESTGTPDQRYVEALYLLLLNRTASTAEVADWADLLPNLGRQGVALGFLQSSEFRTDQSEAYYNALLHRPDDPNGLSFLASSGFDMTTIRIIFEASSEFFANG